MTVTKLIQYNIHNNFSILRSARAEAKVYGCRVLAITSSSTFSNEPTIPPYINTVKNVLTYALIKYFELIQLYMKFVTEMNKWRVVMGETSCREQAIM